MQTKNDMTLEESYDVVIVGGGPAGAATAKALAGSGLNCVILEKGEHKRDKMCSGIILPSARKIVDEHYGAIPDHVYTSPREVMGSRYIRTDDHSGQAMTYPALDLSEVEPNPASGVNVERTEFDHWLCSLSGAPVASNCLFIGHEPADDQSIIRVKHNDNNRKISAKYLVGADGPISRVRRSLLPDFDRTVGWISLYEEQYVASINLDSGWMYWIIDRQCFGSLLRKGEHIHVNIATPDRASAKKTYRRVIKFLQDCYGLSIEKTTLTRGIVMNDMPYRGNTVLGSDNVVLVGEAAGFVRALDGITSALVTGRAAGEAILAAESGGGTAHQHYAQHPFLIAEREACRKAHPELGKRSFFG